MVVTIPANGGVDRVLARRNAIAIPDERLVFRIRISDNASQLLSTTSTLIPRWDLDLPEPILSVLAEDGAADLSTNLPALGIWLEDAEQGGNLPINYLDLFPGDAISFELPDGVQVADLTIRSLYNFRRP